MLSKTNVIYLGRRRDLLAEWDKVRAELATGRATGFCLAVFQPTGGEALYAGGVYREDPNLAVRAILRMSAVRMQEDPPPGFKNG